MQAKPFKVWQKKEESLHSEILFLKSKKLCQRKFKRFCESGGFQLTNKATFNHFALILSIKTHPHFDIWKVFEAMSNALLILMVFPWNFLLSQFFIVYIQSDFNSSPQISYEFTKLAIGI